MQETSQGGLWRRAFSVLACLACILPPPAAAQDAGSKPPDSAPGVTTPGTGAQAPPAGVQPPATKSPKPRIRVVKFVVKGAAGLSEEAIREIVEPYEGTELTLKEIREVAAEISAAYGDEGRILTVAYVPEQEIKNGVVEIAVVEGRIVKAELDPEPAHYEPRFLLGFAERLLENPEVEQDDVVRVLKNLNDLPGLRVRGKVEAGDTAGASVLRMEVEEKHPFWASFHFDNFGYPDNSRYRASSTLGLADLWNAGHWITVTNTVGFPVDRLWAIRPEYHAPVGTNGLILSAAYTHVEHKVGGALALLEPTGDGDMADVWATHPILRRSGLDLVLDAGFEWKDLEQNLLGTRVSHDELSVFRAGFRLECQDGFGENRAFLGARRGVAGFLGAMHAEDDDASRAGAGGGFTTLEFSYVRTQPVNDWLTMIGRVNAQLDATNDPLVLSEMFGIGGPDSVRGYRIYEASGDRGFGCVVEARLRPVFLEAVKDPFDPESGRTLADMLNLVLFYDYGRIHRRDPVPGEDADTALDGCGAGIRAGYPGWVGIRYDVGRPVGGPTPVSDRHLDHYVSVDFTIRF